MSSRSPSWPGRSIRPTTYGAGSPCAALRMDFDGARLLELDAVPLVDGGEREHHVGGDIRPTPTQMLEGIQL